jgi:phage tail sheath protein FI
MPEYLTPAVYVEETTFRSKSIEGVPTSTVGMAGVARYGPVSYEIGEAPDLTRVVVSPTLVTSYTEYERAFGDLEEVHDKTNYLGHAARAFFNNGGRRLYVTRVFTFPTTQAGDIDPACFARLAVGDQAQPLAEWWARWPGQAGREISVEVDLIRGKNVVVANQVQGQPPTRQLRGVRAGALVELAALVGGNPPVLRDETAPVEANVREVARRANGTLGLRGAGDTVEDVPDGQAAFPLRLFVTVRMGAERIDAYNDLELGQEHPRSIFTVLQANDPADEFALVYLKLLPTAQGAQPPTPGQLLTALVKDRNRHFLTGGNDGDPPQPTDLLGEAANVESGEPARGLFALGEVDDIAIVATPDTVRYDDLASQKVAVDNLIGHCERLRYRMAVVDPPKESSISQVREFRSQFDTKYAALYYPWLEILDPTKRPEPGSPPPKLEIPPSGAVAGIYARSDIERGVHKAPANEVVLGITQFENRKNITFDQQAVLNPEGINALRFFEGRANRVWGARTMSSDPEWKYVNVRRLFIFLEHSIDKSTQWAVFEPNNERLWASIRQTVEDFLLVVWRSGALMGTKPEEAYFVRCDRSTMTQNDLDNGRLICLIGVAPTYPAEFVIFRIGQWTADARRS